jgi:hypothetical protein
MSAATSLLALLNGNVAWPFFIIITVQMMMAPVPPYSDYGRCFVWLLLAFYG